MCTQGTQGLWEWERAGSKRCLQCLQTSVTEKRHQTTFNSQQDGTQDYCGGATAPARQQ